MVTLEEVAHCGQDCGKVDSHIDQVSQRVHVAIWGILGPSSRYMGTPLGLKYVPYTYMDPLGL